MTKKQEQTEIKAELKNCGVTEEQVLASCDPKFHACCKELAKCGMSWNTVLLFVQQFLPQIVQFLADNQVFGKKAAAAKAKGPAFDPGCCEEACEKLCAAECDLIESLAKVHAAKHALWELSAG